MTWPVGLGTSSAYATLARCDLNLESLPRRLYRQFTPCKHPTWLSLCTVVVQRSLVPKRSQAAPADEAVILSIAIRQLPWLYQVQQRGLSAGTTQRSPCRNQARIVCKELQAAHSSVQVPKYNTEHATMLPRLIPRRINRGGWQDRCAVTPVLPAAVQLQGQHNKSNAVSKTKAASHAKTKIQSKTNEGTTHQTARVACR